MGNWDWQVFCKNTIDGEVMPRCFGSGGDITYLQWLLSAWGWTLSVALLALVVALLVGSLMGILRTVPDKRLLFLGNAWTELFRNIPLLVQIFLWYHVIPSIFLPLQKVPSFVLVVFALGFFTSARIAEQVKAGIQSLPTGQRYAGLAMGLTLPQTYRYVLLPMAFRIVIPPLTSERMNIIKNSSVAFAVSHRRADDVRDAGPGGDLARHRGLPRGDRRCTSSPPSRSTASARSSKTACRYPA